MRLGSSLNWKIGKSAGLKDRLNSIGAHIPKELLNQNRELALTQKLDSKHEAQEMEQAVLTILASKRTFGERLKASESDLNAA